jgi:hypothetical protein
LDWSRLITIPSTNWRPFSNVSLSSFTVHYCFPDSCRSLTPSN